jgi:hypothetical protein
MKAGSAHLVCLPGNQLPIRSIMLSLSAMAIGTNPVSHSRHTVRRWRIQLARELLTL